MKRKLFLFCALFGASLLLCGFDGSQSATDVLEKSAQSSASAGSISADMGLNCDVSVALNDGEVSTAFPVKLSLDSDIATIPDPFSLGMEGDIDMTILTSSSSKIQLYCLTSDTATDLYFCYSDDNDEEEASWTHVSAGSLNLGNLLSSFATADFSALERLGFDFALSPDAEQFEGVDCYLIYNETDSSSSSALSSVISEFFSDDAVGMLTDELSSFLGYELSSDELMNLFDGLKFNIRYYVDAESYLPLGLHIDLNGSDLPNLDSFIESALKGLLSSFQSEGVEDNTAVDIVINDLSMDYSLSYNDVDAISVPDAALAAPALTE